MFLDGVSVAVLQSLMLCYPERLLVEMRVTPEQIQLTANSSTVSYSETLSVALSKLNNTMQNHVTTYIGGLPGILDF